MHLHWNALHKCGGKQSGDVDRSIIVKPHPLITQEAGLQLRGIRNMICYSTILILGVTAKCHSVALTSVSDKILKESLHEEARSDEVSEHKSPWQQRRLCKHMTLPPRVLKASALYYKSKNIYNMHSYKSHPWKKA